MKGYAASSGHYSDYRVLAIFTDEKKAESWANARGGSSLYNDIDVEEFELDPEPPVYADVLEVTYSLVPEGIPRWIWGKRRKIDTDFERKYRHFEGEVKTNRTWPPPECETSLGWIEGPVDIENRYGLITTHEVRTPAAVTVYGTDHERVLKVFSEKRAMLKSEEAVIAAVWDGSS